MHSHVICYRIYQVVISNILNMKKSMINPDLSESFLTIDKYKLIALLYCKHFRLSYIYCFHR